MKRLLALLVCALLALTACASAENAYPLGIEDFPTVDGSCSALPLCRALLEHMTGCGADYSSNAVRFSANTTGAYYQLLDGAVSLLLAYGPSKEITDYAATLGLELETVPVASDALVFLVNAENPLDGLSSQQIRDIYSGYIVNWNQMPGGAELPIDPFQRPSSTASQMLMETLVMQGVPMTAPVTRRVLDESSDYYDAIASYGNQHTAIGYSTYYYTRHMYTKSDFKLLAVDGVVPSVETIQSGEYPYATTLYAVMRKSEPAGSTARTIAAYLNSSGGRDILNSLGYAGAPSVG